MKHPFALIKKTVVVNKYSIDYIIAIFNKMDWQEDNRSSFSTDQNGEVQIVITFTGRANDFDEDLYVFIQSGVKDKRGTYFSALFPDGIYADDLKKYKELLAKKANATIEVLSVKD